MAGPSWHPPVELIRAVLTGEQVAAMTRMELRGVLWRPAAVVEIAGDRFFATLGYEDPNLPGLAQYWAVTLPAVPKENALFNALPAPPRSGEARA